MRASKLLSIGSALLIATATLSACSDSESDSAPASSDAAAQEAPAEVSDVLESHGLGDLAPEEVVDELDRTPLNERPADLLASVLPDEVVFTTASGAEESAPLPEDQFYLSFAPYIDQTHDCYYHSLTTCTAELGNQDFEVTIVDSETGEDIVNETLTSFDNGFVGVWLPKGIDAELTVQYDGKSASEDISTINDDDATCLTTLQLS
ncbi:MAG: CueP family metal-binding protein [Ancrocorticia sp.]|uniref:CueP family metal-binding protein n=1 Tax=Ancrocorticia sp. TaxID=2593684 RepID=UPI003F8FB3E7